MLLEVCIDSIESGINAEKGGAGRLELCSALSEGGLTPTLGTLKILKKVVHIPIFVMIRPRRGNDFNYTELELDSMVEDIRVFRLNGADGFVFGCLTEAGEIDCTANTKLISACSGLPATFHRAFDVTDLAEMLENRRLIESIGFKRILTSGFESSAKEGLLNIKKLSTDTQLIIMPGAGISTANLSEIITQTNCTELHASARIKRQTKTGQNKISMGGGREDLEPLFVCSEDLVKEMIIIAKSVK